MCGPCGSSQRNLNTETKENDRTLPPAFASTTFALWTQSKTHCPGLGPLTRLILEVVQTLASLYHFGNILLHHVYDLIHLRLHPGDTKCCEGKKAGMADLSQKCLKVIISKGTVISLCSQPDIPVSSSLCLTLSSWPAVKSLSKDFTTSLFKASIR